LSSTAPAGRERRIVESPLGPQPMDDPAGTPSGPSRAHPVRSWPRHDQHRSIDEHRQLIDPLASAPADAGSLIYAHVTAAEDRALARAGGAVAP